MVLDARQIGERLRALRQGAGMAPEQVAERLGISRAGLYKYEKEGVDRLSVLIPAAELFGVSLAALLGIEAEQFATAHAFFERMKRLEAEAEQVAAWFEPVSILLTSDRYLSRFELLLRESLAGDAAGLELALRCLPVLEARRRQAAAPRAPAVTSIVGAPQLARLLREGLTGSDAPLPEEVRRERRAWAREEVARIAALLEAPPIGVQVGVLEQAPPSQTFEVLRLRDGRRVACVSPFRLGDRPNLTLGIATVTAEPATVALYEKLATDLWARALKGPPAAGLLKKMLDEA
jgi:transcriptional regulator with XRE-family HTH domain